MKIKARPAGVWVRIKAFITDLFLIAVPILYVTTYLILGGKEEFQGNQAAILAVWLTYGAAHSLFLGIKAQSPGYKSQNLYLSTTEGQRAGVITAFIRYILFVILFIFGGSIVCFFRKDGRNLHDLLTSTLVLQKSDD